jgi:hypothetical protein
MAQQVINPQTGEVFELKGGQWVPVKAEKAAAPTEKRPELIDSPLQGALISAGDVFSTVGRNARDVYARLRGDEAAQLSIEDERDEAAQLRQQMHEERPYSTFVGSTLPTLPLALLSGGATLPATMAGRAAMVGRAAGTNAALGAVQSESGDYGVDAALGGLFSLGGSAASNVTKRVWEGRKAIQGTRQAGQAATANVTEEEARILAGADRAGMVVLPGQRAGDRTMRQFEDMMSTNPMMGRVFQDIEQANDQQINRLAARAMGVEADNVGATVRAQAEHQIGRSMEDIGERIGQVDMSGMRKRIEDLVRDETVSGLPRAEVFALMKRFEKGAEGRAAAGTVGADTITGPAAMRMRTQLASEMSAAYSSNGRSDVGRIFGQVLDELDNGIEKAAINAAGKDPTAGLELARQYARTREQWTVLKTMMKGGASEDGNVVVGRTASKLGKGDQTRYSGRADELGMTTQRTGTGVVGTEPLGDFYDAVRFRASRIGKPLLPMTGVRGALSDWMNAGSTLGSAAKGGLNMVRRLTAAPLAQAYANMSPQAAQTMMATYAAMKNPGFSPGLTAAGQIGARIAPFIGGQ